MTPERWRSIRPILEAALELPIEQRSAYLDTACRDATLRAEVESFLASHDRAGVEDFATGMAAGLAIDAPVFRLPVGTRIGAYQVMEEVGVGGMGAVYRAMRADGEYEHEAALKIMRAELGGELAAARFRNERQILAELSHPNIAKILDGGVTVEGIPYLVMEFVAGLPITEYCDSHKLGIDQRLHLFLQVCAAVQYAHQRLIVHRDIKPSNILVTKAGTPMLLDFGIAKALGAQKWPEQSPLTVIGGSVLTPEYASPEQYRGEAVTTAADVYSLGMLLYELLSGCRAVRFVNRSAEELTRAMEHDPIKPSDALAREERERIAAARRESTDKLRRRLIGDLDNIVMKAIRKEPGQRYASVEQFAEDLRRHLSGQPVLAGGDRYSYRLRKFVARNKLAVGAAALIVVTLVGGIVATTYQARQARMQQARAEQRFNDVRRLANLLIFDVSDAIRELPGALSTRKLIVEHAQSYLERLSALETKDPTLLSELATAYDRLAAIQGGTNESNVGNSKAALKSFRAAAELRARALALAPTDSELQLKLANSNLRLSSMRGEGVDADEAHQLIQKATLMLSELVKQAPHNRIAQRQLAKAYEASAMMLNEAKDFDQAIGQFMKADGILRELVKADPNNSSLLIEKSFSHKHLGAVFIVQDKLAQALEHYQAARLIDEQLLARSPDNTSHQYNLAFTYSDIGYILRRQGDTDGALDFQRRALAIRAALATVDPDNARFAASYGTSLSKVGYILLDKRDYDGAIEALTQAIEVHESLASADPENSAKRHTLADVEAQLGDTFAEVAFASSNGQRHANCQHARLWHDRARARRGRPQELRHNQLSNADDSMSKRSKLCLALLTQSPENPTSNRSRTRRLGRSQS